MNAPTVDIKDYLTAISSLGLTFATNLFIAKEPATPNECVTLYDYAGKEPQALLVKEGSTYEFPNVQIRVRSTSYTEGFELINMIYNTLHGLGQESINGTLYTGILAKQSPFFLEWDSNARAIFIFNIEIQRR